MGREAMEGKVIVDPEFEYLLDVDGEVEEEDILPADFEEE